MDPEWAFSHSLCRVCDVSGCTTTCSCHSEAVLEAHHEPLRQKPS